MTLLLNTNRNYLALDLEMNQPSNKIIQVGITIGNAGQNPKDWLKKFWYLNPYEQITPEIEALTGINQFNVENEDTPLKDVAQELGDLIYKHNVFVNPVTWGVGDTQLLLKTFVDANIEFKHFGRRWVDVKSFHTFLNFAKGKSVTGGLKSVMGSYKLQCEGTAHRADVDAYNTLKLFFHLLERQSKLEALLIDSREIK